MSDAARRSFGARHAHRHLDGHDVRVRGRDLVNELIGQHSFTEMLYFLTCDRCPTPIETRLLDACLVTLMEHGLTPSAVIARLMADSVPEEPQVAIAAGLLAIGSVYAGTTETCAALLLSIEPRIRSGEQTPIAAAAPTRASQAARAGLRPRHAQTRRSANGPAVPDSRDERGAQAGRVAC